MMRLSLASDSERKLVTCRQINTVMVEYADGTCETFDLVEIGAGYHRIAYTWEPKPNGEGLAKWGGRIETHEIFWTERKINSG